MPEYIPYRDNVFVLLEKRIEEVTASGLIIPQTSKSTARILKGLVIGVGPGTDQWPVDVKVGAWVLIPKLGGELLIVGEDAECASFPDLSPGDEVRVLRANEIICELETDYGQ